MKIGVVSDTHGHFDPELLPILKGVNEILHAGDVGTEDVLHQLQGIALVQAVRGNVDSPALGLAPTVKRRMGGVEIYMVHELPVPQSVVCQWTEGGAERGAPAGECRRFLDSFPVESQVIIFGHSHEACALTLGGKLFFNPGSAGKKRFTLPRCCGLLEITAQGVHATFHGLERYNKRLPEGVWLPVGGAES